MRPSYPDLLKHPWVAAFAKPDTITEEDEDSDRELTRAVDGLKIEENYIESGDPDVAEWVKSALTKKHTQAQQGKVPETAKPALHKVAVGSISPVASPKQS